MNNTDTPKRQIISGLPALLTREETAQLLKVHQRTLSYWHNRGILRARKIGGSVRYLESEVLALLK